MSTPISPSSTVVAVSDHVSSDLAGEEIILDLNDQTYYGLNEVGADVWDLISSPHRVTEICDELENKYAVDPEVLEQDVLDLLTDLHEHGLIQVVSA